MTRDDLQALLERHSAAWNRHDVDGLAAAHAETGIVVSPMFGLATGREQIAKGYAALFRIFPDWTITFEAPVVDGLRLALAFSVTATQQGEFMGSPGSGKRSTFEGVTLVRLREDGLIDEDRRIYDFTGLLTQLGLLRVKLVV